MFKLIVDDEINLLLVHKSFAPRYVELAQENYEYLSQWLAWPRFCKSQEDFQGFVKNSLQEYAEGRAMVCAIEYQNKIIGNAGLHSINEDLKVAEIGYWIGGKYQGNGIVTRVCRYLINMAFESLNMEKIQIAAAQDNTQSRAVCERLGLKLEGIISNREKIDDRILSHAIYGVHRMEVTPENV